MHCSELLHCQNSCSEAGEAHFGVSISFMSVLLFIPILLPIESYLLLTYKTYRTRTTICFIPLFMTQCPRSTLSSSSSPVTAFSCSSNMLHFTCANSVYVDTLIIGEDLHMLQFDMLHGILKNLLMISWSFIQLFFIAYIQCTWQHITQEQFQTNT